MTYRSDSDFNLPYAKLISRNISHYYGASKYPFSWNELLRKVKMKTKQVAWFVSHCNTSSQREKYIQKLQKYIPIDIFGACGENYCPTGSEECNTMLENDYFFYIAFENSLCNDYVTEKFWRIRHFVIPIVISEKNYLNVAPPDSFIAAEKYKSPKSLARALLAISRDPAIYLKYFEWNLDFWITPPTLPRYWWTQQASTAIKALCDLCESFSHAVKENTLNLQKWWNPDTQCTRPNKV